MEAQQTRLDSFKKSKRVKNPTKTSSTTTLKWPHPASFKANPETLAEAGFYYDPSYEDPDNVTCFTCEKELSGWEVDDDPFFIHWTKCGQTCCWASLRCGLNIDLDDTGRFISPDSSRVPSAKLLEKARLETFAAGKGWIHDKERNHGANSKMMARAGFVFTPQVGGDDLATCLYCNTSLSGWDAEDDPVEEHRKRANRSTIPCPFFVVAAAGLTTNKPPSRSQLSKPASKSQSNPASRSTSRSKHQDVLLPTKTHDGDPDAASDSAQPSVLTTTAKTPQKPRSTSGSRKSSAKTPRGKARTTSQSSLKNVAEADEEEEVSVAPPTVKKKGRARSKSVARSEVTEQTEVEDDEQETQRKPSRSRAKSRALENVEDDVPRKPSRSKPKPAVTAPAQTEEVPRKPSRTRSKSKIPEVEEHEEPPATVKPKKTTRTASRSNPKVPIDPPDVESEEEPRVAAAAPNRGRKPKPKAQVLPAESLFDEDVVMDDYAPPPSSPPASSNQPSTELPPLFVPKRAATHPPEDVQPVEKEKRKPGRPKGKTKPTPQAAATKEDKVEIEHDVFTTSHPPLAPVSNNPFLPSLTKSKAVEKMKALVKNEDSMRVPMKVVEISSDEDEEPEPEPESNSRADANEGNKENTQESTKSTTIPQPDFGTKPTSGLGKRPKKVSAEVVPPSTVASTPATVTVSLPVPDITMDHITAAVQADPSTPPAKRSSLNLWPVASAEPTEPLIVPPLSKLPFTPLHTLSEAELDMTVEEWIRYQMEVEYDKFRRDGERELQRFRQRAEEVRKVIEGL